MQYLKRYGWAIADFCAGVMAALAFAPFDFAWFIIIALSILFASWQQVSARQAGLRSYFFGIGFFGVGVSWVFVSLYKFGDAHILVAVFLTSLFCGFWAIFPALSGYLAVKLFGKQGCLKLIAYPVVWMLIEYIRGEWVLNGFPWLQIAYSQIDTFYAGYIPIIGIYGAGFLVAISAMIISVLIQSRNFKTSILLLLFGIAFGGYYWQNHAWTQPIGEPIKVTLIQGNISQDQKWRSEVKQKTLDLYRDKTAQHWDSNVVIWPETAIPAFLHEVDEEYLMPLHQMAQKNNTDLIVSLPVKDLNSGEYYNAVLALTEGRKIYKKIHLLPFGEYLPLQPFSGYILNSLKIMPIGSFSAGSFDQPLLVAGGYPFITTICYEDVFAEVDETRLAQAAYLVNVTNDGWFGDSIEPYQHMQIARMRALESGRFLLRATNTGLTGIVNPYGKIVEQLPLFKIGILTADIVPMTGLTPITKIGNNKVMALFLFMFLSLLLINKFRNFMVLKR